MLVTQFPKALFLTIFYFQTQLQWSEEAKLQATVRSTKTLYIKNFPSNIIKNVFKLQVY